jgi:hypothetical protein
MGSSGSCEGRDGRAKGAVTKAESMARQPKAITFTFVIIRIGEIRVVAIVGAAVDQGPVATCPARLAGARRVEA